MRIAFWIAVAVLACGAAPVPPNPAKIEVSSTFASGADIPADFTCDGANLSPPLHWSAAPAKAWALVVDDPDAPGGTWVHWIAWNLPTTSLAASEPANDAAFSQGTNDFGNVGYGGPCPPHGPAHRYFFRIYALDARLDLAPGAKRSALDAAMTGHIVAEGELLGKYARK